ncbi:MAG: hypothetical protein ABS882_01410 [Lysinibacillus sp.]
MKQPTIIVEGNRHAVVNIEWFEGKPIRVGVMKNGVYTVLHDLSQSTKYYTEPQLQIDLSEALEFSTEKEDALVEHLEAVLNKEDAELKAMAVEAMESEAEEPFALNLLNKQQEYKKAQTRVFGMIDAVEEVKAFLEGFYVKAGES